MGRTLFLIAALTVLAGSFGCVHTGENDTVSNRREITFDRAPMPAPPAEATADTGPAESAASMERFEPTTPPATSTRVLRQPMQEGLHYLVLETFGADRESADNAAAFLVSRGLPIVVDSYDADAFYLRSAVGWDFTQPPQQAKAETFRTMVLSAGRDYRKLRPDARGLDFGEVSNRPYFYRH